MALSALVLSAGPARADTDDERVLADKFAPVLMLVTQSQACGAGEPYRPSDVDVMFDNPTIALRGPWRPQRDLVKVGPSAKDVSQGLPGYALDLPGDPLNPACEYERWARKQWGKSADPTAYAHLATQKGVTDRIALQFYFFYPFNDYNNKHETDWERIQLEFDAPDAATALRDDLLPTKVVYSQHYGSEFATWGDAKLELVDEVHPVVYVSAGSHANQFSAGVFMGNSAVTGFGCDITSGDHVQVRPVVQTIPSDPAEALEAFPWTGFLGHWGEVGPRRFYEGPTGPNRKAGWTKPFEWSKSARPNAAVVPGSSVANSGASQFYCDVIGKGSNLFRSYVDNAPAVLAVLAALLLLAVWAFRRMQWVSPPVPVARQRSSGQIVYASGRLLAQHPFAFVLVAAPMAVLSVLAAVVQTYSRTHAVPTAVTLGLDALALLGLLLAAGATTAAMEQAALGHPRVHVGSAYVQGARRLLRGSPALVVAALSILLLSGSLVLAPLALVLLGAWTLLVSVIVVERRGGFTGLGRSLSLLRHSLSTTLPVLLLMLLLISTAGALLATLVFVVAPVPFVVLNAVPALALAFVWPFTCLLANYCYFSAASERTVTYAAERRP